MSDTTKIQWADHTFNPWIGCEKISPGCAHCYAAVDTFARRSRANGRELWGADAARHVTSDANWKKPLAWDRAAAKAGVRRRVFCALLADVLENRDDLVEPRARLFALIDKTPNLDWLLLTKRPESFRKAMERAADWHFDHGDRNVCGRMHDCFRHGLPWRNVWWGATVEDYARAKERIPRLGQIPAVLRFLSVEPMLELVDLQPWLQARLIDWVIVGGESGPRARPCDCAWIRVVVEQCHAADVPAFVKQFGSRAVRGTTSLNLRDRKGGDPTEWWPDLRVRQLPVVGGR